MMVRHQSGNKGITIIEVLVVIALLGGIWMVIGTLLKQSLSASRLQLQQGNVSTTARINMQRMRDILREGRITSAGSNSISVDFEGDSISYQISGSTLSRTTAGITTTVATSVANQDEGINLFQYFTIGAERAHELDPSAGGFHIDYVDQVLVSLAISDDSLAQGRISDVLLQTNIWLRELP